MTTIIVLNNTIYADRRKVVNHALQGIAGAEIGDKIITTPYCHYATTGFVPTPAQRTQIEKTLAAIHTLYGVMNPKGVFAKSLLGKMFRENKDIHKAVTATVNMLVDRLKMRVGNADCKLIAINDRYNTIMIGNDTHVDTTLDCKILGGGDKVASTLLHHGESIASVYQAIRGMGLPTGAVYDERSGAQFANGLMPPITSNDFIYRVMEELSIFNQNKNDEDPQEDHDLLTNLVLSLLAVFMAIGSFDKKKNKIKYHRNLTAAKLKQASLPESSYFKFLYKGYKEKGNK